MICSGRPLASASVGTNMRILSASIILALIPQRGAPDQVVERAYVDPQSNVHAVSAQGADVVVMRALAADPGILALGKSGFKMDRTVRFSEPVISPDRLTVAWTSVLALQAMDGEPCRSMAARVYIHRNGRTRFIDGDPFIRNIWFVDRGRKIGIEFGGLHFAGREALHDTATLKRLAGFSQARVPAAERPPWSATSNRFQEQTHEDLAPGGAAP